MIIFALGTVVPGDAATIIVGTEFVTPERIAKVREELGLDDPLPLRYWDWLSGAIKGDFGESLITSRPISDDIVQQFAVSLELAILSLLLATLLGIPIGVYAASRLDSPMDKLFRGSSLVFFSVPTFVTGVLLVLIGSRYIQPLFVSFYVKPTEDLVENLRAMVLPVICVALPVSAMLAQMTRAMMIGSLHEDFILTARAKGVREFRVRNVHALRDALGPVVTLIGLELGVLIGGLIIVERIFNLPGLGRGVLTAILTRDYPFVIAGTLVIAAVFLVSNLIVDLLYAVLDPRQRSV